MNYVKCTIGTITSDDRYIYITAIFTDDIGTTIVAQQYILPLGATTDQFMELNGIIKSRCRMIYNGSLIGVTISEGDIITSE